ncbi:MAG: hypothetical protein HGA36_03235 [Candidatus Moranbacteria bacterium]|nr:hypothetical protein [Candidatus Moranbacteria bacterium]
MKNKKTLLFVSATMLISGGLVCSAASAQEGAAVKTGKTVETQEVKSAGKTVQQTNDASAAVTTTSATTAVSAEAQTTQDKAKEDKPKTKKVKVSAQEHRSMVATFVQSLLAVADREGGIGQEVKVIAQQQNETKDRAADLINAVEGRSKVKTFFIGTSYKNLGELRSQMVQARNQIEQLKKLADKAENPENKTELQTQIQTLEQQQIGLDSFIAENESKFSLFGWAVKMFRK